MFTSSEDVAWMLLQVTGIAVLYLVARKLLNEYPWSLSHLEGPSRKQTVSTHGTGDAGLPSP